jgi:hypothetical protein
LTCQVYFRGTYPLSIMSQTVVSRSVKLISLLHSNRRRKRAVLRTSYSTPPAPYKGILLSGMAALLRPPQLHQRLLSVTEPPGQHASYVDSSRVGRFNYAGGLCLIVSPFEDTAVRKVKGAVDRYVAGRQSRELQLLLLPVDHCAPSWSKRSGMSAMNSNCKSGAGEKNGLEQHVGFLTAGGRL